jgi:hypothetical protein
MVDGSLSLSGHVGGEIDLLLLWEVELLLLSYPSHRLSGTLTALKHVTEIFVYM